MAKVENAVHRMETLYKELVDAEAVFHESKRKKAHLDRLEAEAHATISQYDIKHPALTKSYQEYVNHIESIIGVDVEDANSKTAAAEAYMAFKCDWLRTRLCEFGVEMRQLLERPP